MNISLTLADKAIASIVQYAQRTLVEFVEGERVIEQVQVTPKIKRYRAVKG
jgi:hypothetical protein